MAATQLPPLQFEEGGLQIVLLPSLEDEHSSSSEDPFADYLSRYDEEHANDAGIGRDSAMIQPLQSIPELEPEPEPEQNPPPALKPQTYAPPSRNSPRHNHHLETDKASTSSSPNESLPGDRYSPQSQTKGQPEHQPGHQPEHQPGQESTQPLEKQPERQLEQQPQHETKHEPQHEPQPDSPQELGQDDYSDHARAESPTVGELDAESEESVPQHPIPVFQSAFGESLREATEGTADQKPRLQSLDAKARREMLLSQDKDDEPFDIKWRYRPGQTQHEVMKLVAQISFGVYLMFNGMANSNSQVIGILQGHIDEVDEFLEVALEDLNQAVDDLTKRIQHLKLPMENIAVFEQLLEDRRFRAEILAGNERIDAILTRTNVAMRQWDDDIEAGLRSSTLFTTWLNDQAEGDWRQEQPDLVDVYDAMKGNTEGWLNAFEDMNDRAQEINGLIMTLMTIITEMESRAGEVSRRTWTSVPPFSTPAGTSVTHQSTHKAVKGASPSPPPSRHSNTTKSPIPSMNQAYMPNPLSLTPNESNKGDEEDDDDDMFFPLPGGLPLLPPSTTRSRDTSSISSKPRSDTATETPPVRLTESDSRQSLNKAASKDPSLYILQPRTYTPQLPAPVPSPRLRATPSPVEAPPLRNRMSLRDRITNPPTSIQIPPTATPDSPLFVPSSNFGSPRTASSMHDLRSHETGHQRPPPRPRAGSPMDTPTSDMRTFTPSPFSERHVFQPVRASPHSPLQQRPHTASTPQRPGTAQTAHKPTPLGAMTNMSTVTVARSIDERGNMSSAMSTRTDRQLKKKKSAFGWFKKAFTMDEEERAAFESRRAAAAKPNYGYYDQSTPKFLDGRRIR